MSVFLFVFVLAVIVVVASVCGNDGGGDIDDVSLCFNLSKLC